jgi:hypothetical protein
MAEQQNVDEPQLTLGQRMIRPLAGAVGAAILIAASWFLFTNAYLNAQKALDQGAPGSYIFEDCARARGGDYCGGTFRSADGRLNLDLDLEHPKDVNGMKAGDSFPARVYVSGSPETPSYKMVRSDSEGRANVMERGVSMAGIGVVGLMLAGFAVRSVLLPRGRPGRRKAGLILGWGVTAGLLMFCVGGYMGTGV